MLLRRRKRVEAPAQGHAQDAAQVDAPAPAYEPAEDAARRQAEAEVLAALELVAQHAEAGRKAVTNGAHLEWAPPQMWSQTSPAPAPKLAAVPALEGDDEVDDEAVDEAEAEPPAVAAPAAPAAQTFEVPAADLLRVFDAVTAMCDHVIEYIEADRAERPLMISALTELNRSLGERAINADSRVPANGEPARGERVIGGSMDAGPQPAHVETVIDVRQPETAVEVRCRFGDRWVDGFEICEVLHDEFGIRYRLRRRVDDAVLPDLFDAADIRHIETFEQLTSAPPPTRHWSPI